MIFCQRDFLMNSISTQLQLVQDRIAQACQVSRRTPNSVELIAVSKTQPATYVKLAFEAGQRHFGENYVQEAIEKIIALQDIKSHMKWHFIGPLQSNKTLAVAENFDWVQSIDRLKIAQRLSQQRPSNLPDLQVLVQVNMSGENSKSGTHPSEAEALCKAITKLPHLKLRGLMSIPEAGNVALAEQQHLLLMAVLKITTSQLATALGILQTRLAPLGLLMALTHTQGLPRLKACMLQVQ
jgi:pyridoxal phosphate enzyme (YggS family)